MTERYAWLTFVCVLCVLLNVNLSRAADDDEHVHIKVRMPDVGRKHPKSHKYHHPHYHKPQYSVQLLSHHPTYEIAKYKKRAVKHTTFPRQKPLLAPPPRRPQPLLTHNHLDLGIYSDGEALSSGIGGVGGDLGTSLRGTANMHNGVGDGLRDPHLLYSNSLAHKIPAAVTPNYGPAVFEHVEEGDSSDNNIQHYDGDASTTMVTMPGSSQQLMQHMELMGALAAAAAAAAAAAGGGDGEAESEAGKIASASGGVGGGGGDERNTLLANDFLAQLQNTYANGGKYPTAYRVRPKKKQRGEGLRVGLAGNAAEAYRLNVAQEEIKQQHQELLRQQYKQQQEQSLYQQQQQSVQQQQSPQHFYGANYITQQAKPQALMYGERAPTGNNDNYAHYKNKYYYKNNNNDIYANTATDATKFGYTNGTPTSESTADDGDEDVDEMDEEDAEEDNELEDDADASVVDAAPFYYSSRPTTTAAASPLTPLTTTYNSISDYEDATTDDDRQQQYVYKSSNNNKYHLNSKLNNNNYYEVGVNPVSYQSTTAYGGAPHAEQPLTPATMSHLKLHRPYRQLQQKQQQKYQYNTFKPLAPGFTGHQQLHGLHQLQQQQQQQQQQLQQHYITTAQPINVIGPTATDFDEPQQQQQQQKHKYSTQSLVAGLSAYKKRNKNRIKAKFNRNRIPAH